MLDNRARIIDAAARVYAAHGYRGATTRLIAEEAGVNEVTLFRHFGSKSALLDAMIAECVDLSRRSLPAHPKDPEGELLRWVSSHMQQIAAKSSLLRQVMREVGDHPQHIECAGKGPAEAAEQLREYVVRLRRHGWLVTGTRDAVSAVEVAAAVSMLMSALFVDAMDREMMPHLFSTPADEAPRAYVRLFLRSLGARDDAFVTATTPSDPGLRTERTIASQSLDS
jgi:AcrR family transcriptional regulator